MCRLRTRESRNPVEWENRVPVAGSVPVFPRVSLRLAPDATTALHGAGGYSPLFCWATQTS